MGIRFDFFFDTWVHIESKNLCKYDQNSCELIYIWISFILYYLWNVANYFHFHPTFLFKIDFSYVFIENYYVHEYKIYIIIQSENAVEIIRRSKDIHASYQYLWKTYFYLGSIKLKLYIFPKNLDISVPIKMSCFF